MVRIVSKKVLALVGLIAFFAILYVLLNQSYSQDYSDLKNAFSDNNVMIEGDSASFIVTMASLKQDSLDSLKQKISAIDSKISAENFSNKAELKSLLRIYGDLVEREKLVYYDADFLTFKMNFNPIELSDQEYCDTLPAFESGLANLNQMASLNSAIASEIESFEKNYPDSSKKLKLDEIKNYIASSGTRNGDEDLAFVETMREDCQNLSEANGLPQ